MTAPLSDDARIAELEQQIAERTRERDGLIGRPVLKTEWEQLMERAERAEAERDAAVRLAEAAERDAWRYRWLRGDVPAHSLRWPRWEIRKWDGSCWDSLQLDELDAAIDAAMRGAEKPNANLP